MIKISKECLQTRWW